MILQAYQKTMALLERHIVFPLVYCLIKLALLLLVVSAAVERAFLAMKIVKIEFCNMMTDGCLNDLTICYIEREIVNRLDIQKVKKAFKKKER
jgi:hypothetical protein